MMCDLLFLGFSLSLVFSRFIHTIALCGRVLFHGVHDCPFVRSSVDGRLGCFRLLVTNTPVDFGLRAALFSSPGGVCLGAELLGHMVVILRLTFRPSFVVVSDGSAALLPPRPLSPCRPPGLPSAPPRSGGRQWRGAVPTTSVASWSFPALRDGGPVGAVLQMSRPRHREAKHFSLRPESWEVTVRIRTQVPPTPDPSRCGLRLPCRPWPRATLEPMKTCAPVLGQL